MRKFMIFLILVAPLLLFSATVEQLFSVQTVKVKAQKNSISQKGYGYVRTDASRVYDTVSRFGGYIITLYVDKVYQKVKKGERLAKVYSPEVLQAKEDYLNALNYTRQRSNTAMVESAKEKLQLLGVSDREIEVVKKSRKAGMYTYIYAPSSGYVFSKNINNRGSFNAKQTLFTIANLDKVWIEMKVYQKDIFKYRDIQDFSVTALGLERTFRAKKIQLYPEMDPKEATATLRLEAVNTKGELLAGMYTTIMASSSAKMRLTLPATAVIRKDGQYYVFVVGEFKGEYEPIVVDAAVLDANTYSIESGLKEGDEVVDNALFMMDSDAQINSLY